MNWKNLLSCEVVGLEYEVGDNAKKYLYTKHIPSAFELNYYRIINSASFRRLQDKTQVFPLDKSDFVRTRLTHSIETATIAKRIGIMIIGIILERENSNNYDNAIYAIPDIMMCAGLLHDIGNPPFGHFGESVIGEWFGEYLHENTFNGKKLVDVLETQAYKDLVNFEGNAQALRLITSLPFFNSDFGMNLTCSVINTIIKYPTISTGIKTTDDIKDKKMGIFYAEKALYDEIAKFTGAVNCRHPLTYLLEAADDIAYHTADIEDAFKKKIFSLDELKKFIEKQIPKYRKKMDDYTYEKVKTIFDKLTEIENDIREKRFGCGKNVGEVELTALQNWLEYIRGWLMYVVTYSFGKNYGAIMAGNFTKSLFAETFHENTLKILMDILREFVFKDRQIVKLELSAQTIISSLLDKFIPAILYFDTKDSGKHQSKTDDKLISLIPKNYLEEYYIASHEKPEKHKLYLRFLLITDFISGMTDTYAKNLYQELNGF